MKKRTPVTYDADWLAVATALIGEFSEKWIIYGGIIGTVFIYIHHTLWLYCLVIIKRE